MTIINFLGSLHTSISRNYIQRVVENDKAVCAEVAREWGKDYWDGDRKYGYGGYIYDGRWQSVATDMVEHYELKSNHKILDIGCGKGYLLFELTRVVPGISVTGIDISEYGINNSKDEVKSKLLVGNCTDLPYADSSFDYIFSLNTFHNLKIFELKKAFKEIQRISRGKSYICVESYRNEAEKVNLLYWQLTCNSFYSVEEWQWLATECGYKGDLGFIFFE
jgi:SAM-dependent methyltransferase